MIPLTIAEEIRATLLDYLTTTFSFQDQAVEHALLDFFTPQQPGNSSEGLFKGPYTSLRMPFRKADPGTPIPLEISPTFTPYAHQMRAFERLSTHAGRQPQPTLITTGTGSGKTECFLYPILDYCYAHRREPGIKAIILYPMNALATDQAGRLARVLATDDRLNGQITAGMYIGGEGEQRHSTMGVDHLIDDRDTLRKRPPDILLTNYRMLDFLLLRPEDKTLWAENSPETLRFLVLDELHTYDGAQGSDVACLIRRLKARLNTPEGLLCPIGTSATVVSDQGDTQQLLTEYADQIFGVPFSPESVILEDRLGLDDFFLEPPEFDSYPADLTLLPEINGESYESYIQRQLIAWFPHLADATEMDPVALAEFLREHSLLRALLTQIGNSIVSLDDLIGRLVRWDPTFTNYSHDEQAFLLQSFLALVAHARVNEDGMMRPFLTCQVQLWVREISRLMREVNTEPRFFWRDDVPLSSERRGLPAYFCRECGHTGWLAFQREGDDYLVDDLKTIYPAYFNSSKHIRYVYPRLTTNPFDAENGFVCPSCLTVSSDAFCKACRERTVPVYLFIETTNPRIPKEQPKDTRRCPLCGTDGALSIVGSQAASLSSVAISHLYTTPLNQDKKLLAFTDSVQDASHRASFFEARTYRFNLRTAIQSALETNNPVSLDALTDQVLNHWRQAWSSYRTCEQRLVATFMPPDLHDLPVYEEYMNQSQQATEQGLVMSLPIPDDLEHKLRQRLSWEILMEYGFTARVGRSLEKVGSSVAYIDPDLIDKTIEHLALVLPEEIGSLANLDSKALRYFLLGLFERTRVRGGIEHPLLGHYAQDQGNWYMLTKKMQPLLSPFHKNTPRFPRFLTDSTERDVFDLFVTAGSRRTWFVDWAQKSFGPQLEPAEINELYRLVVQASSQYGLLKKHTNGAVNAYGLLPKNIWVTGDAIILKCDQCGHLQTVANNDLAHWSERNCLNYRCQGKYSQEAQTSQHYYREVYQRGQVERIFAHEHTGLLRRETREKIEKQFKQQTRADATNLLTATPTLELGIDIGDLSSTMACSVPPAPANYLQRIGRAGRKTGNSLILTLANAQPHDLYFFEEPLEMMAGTITPPGCYLDAPDMLKRQFLAFCMDTWTANDPKATLLPHDVQKMLAGLKKGGFPENLLGFFVSHRQDLIDRFIAIFDPVLSIDNKERLREYHDGDAMPSLVRKAIADIEVEREELRSARKNLKFRRDKVEADPAQYQDPVKEIKRLEQDMALLLDMIKRIEDQYVLNFFTDAGLLPNYAFPETGVRLVGVITGIEKSDPGGKNYELKEYIRPAPLALREIAPFNHFYAEGHKLTVSHMDIAGREKAIERWQFCDQCSHMELVQASHYSATCPACGSAIWSDQGQQHDMLLFRKATAYVESHESRVSDDGDDREREFYNTSHFFEMDPSNSRGAYLLSKLPFGIEYLDQVTLREINFGPADTHSQSIPIGGEDRPQQGFKTCRDCGLTVDVSPHNNNQKPARHTRNCASSTSAQALDWENLYLYRTVTSEAIRILLPVSTTLVDQKMSTFEACLDLGLRKKFRGNPDHLHILSHSEPAEDGSRRRYLVIYDSVPGGTGFLKDLVRPENFFDILQLALDTLVSCKCRMTPEKQACYRCLYSYKVQRELKLISRQLGIEMLSEILGQKANLETIPSLSHTHIDSLIESELEQRFVFALEKYCKGRPERSFTPIIYNGKQAWEIKLGALHWIMEPQVLLGSNQSVSVVSCADFVFWPQNPSNARPVVVFTDGFAYHVKLEAHQGGIADDIYKRRAVISSNKYIVWSIVWDDVKAFENDESLDFHFFNPQQIAFYEQGLAGMNNAIPRNMLKKNAIELLFVLLSNPNMDIWSQGASLLMLAALHPPRPMLTKEVLEQKTEGLRTSIVLPDLSIPTISPTGDHFYNILSKNANHLLVDVPVLAVQNKKSSQFVVTLRLEDQQFDRRQTSFRQDWHQFWFLTNLLQFLPGFSPVSSEYIQLTSPQPLAEMLPAFSVTDEWNSIFKFAASDVQTLLTSCQAAQLPTPEVGYELVGDNGKIIAVAELAWEDRKVAVFLPQQKSDWQSFNDLGWHTFRADQTNQILGQLKDG
jgi:DEAD/DEAH box helicase domain-containing protein